MEPMKMPMRERMKLGGGLVGLLLFWGRRHPRWCRFAYHILQVAHRLMDGAEDHLYVSFFHFMGFSFHSRE